MTKNSADTYTVFLAQRDFMVGDIPGNVEEIISAYQDGVAAGADIVLLPEMAITGYPPEDLVRRRSFQKRAMDAVEMLAQCTRGKRTALLLGGLWVEGETRYNAAFLLSDGKIAHQQFKAALPNEGVFDEKRVFGKGSLEQVKCFELHGMKVGLLICEDLWQSHVTNHLAEQNPELILSIHASPYEAGKARKRADLTTALADKTKAPVVYHNLVGGQDELVFDGRSFAINPGAQDASVSLHGFEEQDETVQLKKTKDGWRAERGEQAPSMSHHETFYRGMVLALRDYVLKNKFEGVVLGLSGGIDSALSAAVAVDALGADMVHGVLMPSPYTSDESIEQAELLAERLDIETYRIDIMPGMTAMEMMLTEVFEGYEEDTTEENIQARLRGNLLMAISNKRGWMVLTTGNKSEMSVGYATLYGDMCGGYSVLKDVYKTTVYALARWRNKNLPDGLFGPAGEVIPNRTITRPPSAELRHGQLDQDSLPPYEVLDAILRELIERQQPVDAIVRQGFERETVQRISNLVVTAEYKRRQAPPGVKISGMAFGRDWRYPITNRFRA